MKNQKNIKKSLMKGKQNIINLLGNLISQKIIENKANIYFIIFLFIFYLY